MMGMDTAKSPPLQIDTTLNQDKSGAIFHINCWSDGNVARWMEGKEEGSEGAKQVWLSKLGCLLKLHGNIKYMFKDPWAYRIADFPEGYKLFEVERQAKGNDPPTKDHYLCGGECRYRSPQEFYPHMHWLLDNAQGASRPCVCQYCDPSRTQKEINAIFPLPPNKKTLKGPKGPKKHQKTRKQQRPRGVTTLRVIVKNRNSIYTSPATIPGRSRQGEKVIGCTTSHPFQP